jgi:hypothetical protein
MSPNWCSNPNFTNLAKPILSLKGHLALLLTLYLNDLLFP